MACIEGIYIIWQEFWLWKYKNCTSLGICIMCIFVHCLSCESVWYFVHIKERKHFYAWIFYIIVHWVTCVWSLYRTFSSVRYFQMFGFYIVSKVKICTIIYRCLNAVLSTSYSHHHLIHYSHITFVGTEKMSNNSTW